MISIYDNLVSLTDTWFFYKIEQLKNVIANYDDFIGSIDVSDCIEFGTYNGQEILIYNEVSGRKHIKYSAMFTRFFDMIVIQNIYSEAGKVFEFDFDSTFDKIECQFSNLNS